MRPVVLITSKVITLDKEVSGLSHVQEQRLHHLTWLSDQIFLGKPRFVSSFSSGDTSYHKRSTETAKESGRLLLLSGT